MERDIIFSSLQHLRNSSFLCNFPEQPSNPTHKVLGILIFRNQSDGGNRSHRSVVADQKGDLLPTTRYHSGGIARIYRWTQ